MYSYLLLFGGIFVLLLISKYCLWDEPHKRIKQLETELARHIYVQQDLNNKISSLRTSLADSEKKANQLEGDLDSSNRSLIAVRERLSSLLPEIRDIDTLKAENIQWQRLYEQSDSKIYALEEQIQYMSIAIADVQKEIDISKSDSLYWKRLSEQAHLQISSLEEQAKKLSIKITQAQEQKVELLRLKEFVSSTNSNLTAIPYMAKIIADYETYDLEHLASCLSWGYDYKRLKKVQSIREIREEAQMMVEKNKEAQY